MTFDRLSADPLRPDTDDEPWTVPPEQRLDLSPSPLRWRLWWRFGFGPLIRLINLVPTAEWRRETWVWRLDIWGMDHFGTTPRHMKAEFDGLRAYESKTPSAFILPGRWALVVAAPFVAVGLRVVWLAGRRR
jgi:hypothetical protein